MIPSYSVKHIPTPGREDGGGIRQLTAFTPDEKDRLITEFGLFSGDVRGKVRELLSDSPLSHTTDEGDARNGAWFVVTGRIEREFLAPYYSELLRRTGYSCNGHVPDMPSPRLLPQLQSYEILDLYTKDGCLHYTALYHSQDWGKRKALDGAIHGAAFSLQLKLGEIKREPEYRHGSDGRIYPNPDYLRQHPPHPAFDSDWFWYALVDWWLDNVASEKQKTVVKKSGDLHMANTRRPSDLHDRRSFSGIRTAWEGPACVLTWQQFINKG